MRFGIDIIEDEIRGWGYEILDTLLIDHTTDQNITWATDDYSDRGEGYTFFDQITKERICGENSHVIVPRILKNKEDQKTRARKMAEVFTPSWLCNQMLNDVDERLFGRPNVFNDAKGDKAKVWQASASPVFQESDKLTWKEYVTKTVMEITCGEAPFIVSRYDTVTGEFFEDVNLRVGFLDRKFRIITEQTKTKEDWIHWVKIAYKCSFGYEWQGDNLLLARQNLLLTFFDYYEAVWKELPPMDLVKEIAIIISWNIWQMDGLKYVLPNSCKPQIFEEGNMFSEPTRIEIPCEGCKKGSIYKHTGIYAKMMDWSKKEVVRAVDYLNQKDNDK